MLKENPDVISIETQIEVSKDASITTILLVTTDLELDCRCDEFNSGALDDICYQIAEEMRQNSNIDKAQIVRPR